MSITTEYQKDCPECGDNFEAQRLNQIYCSVKCKSRYNNRKARIDDESLTGRKRITHASHQILWKNRQLLKKYFSKEVNLIKFIKLGFKLNNITRFFKDKKDRDILVVYDYAYYFIDKNTIKVCKL